MSEPARHISQAPICTALENSDGWFALVERLLEEIIFSCGSPAFDVHRQQGEDVRRRVDDLSLARPLQHHNTTGSLNQTREI